jgi:hypothetical protein
LVSPPGEPGYVRSVGRETQSAILNPDPDRVARLEGARQDSLRQRVLELLLDRAFQRPRPVDRVETEVAEEVQCFVVDRKCEFASAAKPASIAGIERTAQWARFDAQIEGADLEALATFEALAETRQAAADPEAWEAARAALLEPDFERAAALGPELV